MKRSPAQIVLEAVRHVANSDVPALQCLVVHHVATLNLELVLRILLTYLPESAEPSSYTIFLRDLVSGSLSPLDEIASSTESTADLPDSEARRRVRKLHLLPLANYVNVDGTRVDLLTAFLLDRAYRIDSETGELPVLQQLLEPFLNHSQYLRTWTISTLLPILRLNYEYYPYRAPMYSLKSFEALEGSAAVSALLSEALREDKEQHNIDLGRDLRGLIGPWMYRHSRKRRKLDNTERGRPSSTSNAPSQIIEEIVVVEGWDCVNEWLLDLSLRDFNEAAKAIEQWDGPLDVDYGGWHDDVFEDDRSQIHDAVICYGQAGLAAIYASQNTSSRALDGSHVILRRVAELLDIPTHSDPLKKAVKSSNMRASSEFIGSLSPPHFLHNDLLRSSNHLTWPSKESLGIALVSVNSAQAFQSLGYPQSTKSSLFMALFGNMEGQKDLLRKTLHALREGRSRLPDDNAWRKSRESLLWLRDWGFLDNDRINGVCDRPLGVFCQIESEEFDAEILKTFLAEGRML